jgi:hypothetical protein
MCDYDANPETPCTDEHAPVANAPISRRRILQSGLALGALAAVPTTGIAPLFPDPGSETRGAEPNGTPRPRVAVRPNWPVPPIVTRAEWGADESLRAPDGDFDFDSVVTKLVVHHTVTPNTATSDASVVRGIYNYHTSNGYFDIAYSYLIGRDGRLYEGRWAQNYAAGAPHTGENAQGRNVRAAHSSNTNTQTIGVALLGDYRATLPTPAQIETLETFLAWKIARWGLQVYSDVPYLDGRVFSTITGHRDVTQTECPGDGMYGLLSEVRYRTELKTRSGTRGYWIVSRGGQVEPLGELPDLGDPARVGSAFPIVGMAMHPTAHGFWCASSDGGIFGFGNAGFFGSAGNIRLNRPIVGMAATPSGNGYWLVASDGGIFGYGDAAFYGSAGNIRLNRPIVGIAATPTGRGYWLVASDGGIFGYGDAAFYGSAGNIRLNQPIVGIAATPTGRGYWLVASDGGIFGYGDAAFYGSAGAIKLNSPITSIAGTASGRGYWLLAADGGIFGYGDAGFFGSAAPFGRTDCIAMVARQ